MKQRYWEIPQGSWETEPDADPAIVAAGELREETGLIAETLTYIGHMFQAYGHSNQGFHVYMASGFTTDQQALDSEEEGLITKRISLDEFERMMIEGVIKDGITISSYGLARLKGLV